MPPDQRKQLILRQLATLAGQSLADTLVTLISQFGLTGLENPDRVDVINRKEREDGVRGGGGAS
jgi:hypothetical protein